MASIDEIWTVDFGDPHPSEPALERPAVVVGPPDDFGPRFPVRFVVPFTSTDRGLTLHVGVSPTRYNGLRFQSYAQPESLRSVNRDHLSVRLGILDPVSSERIRRAIRILLGL